MYDCLCVWFHFYTHQAYVHIPIDHDLIETTNYSFDPYSYWTLIHHKNKQPRNIRNHNKPHGPYQIEKATYEILTQQHE